MSKTTNTGFTLVELAVVVMVLGLLLAGLLVPLSAQMDVQRIKRADSQLELVQDALAGFAVLNRRLPCPDTDDDGFEDGPACAGVEAYLPWATLGMPRGDPWGKPLRYRADDGFTAAAGIPIPPDTLSGLQVETGAGDVLTDGDPDAPVAVVFSCGKNGMPDGGNDANGSANTAAVCDNPGAPNNVYVADDFVADTFDDRLVWMSKHRLINKLVAASVWP